MALLNSVINSAWSLGLSLLILVCTVTDPRAGPIGRWEAEPGPHKKPSQALSTLP